MFKLVTVTGTLGHWFECLVRSLKELFTAVCLRLH